jgi:hypothetical protein
MSTEHAMFGEIERLVRNGFAVHWLHPKSKRPIGEDWSVRPVATVERLKQSYRIGNNAGVRLGRWSKVGRYYLHIIDMDVWSDEFAAEATRKLSELFPEYKSFPAVLSGSGGASRHFYIVSDQPFTSKKLAHSTEFFKDDKGSKHWNWEIELFGTGKQVVLPPSIHPDTGKPYTWLSTFDFDDLDLGIGPIISAERLGFLSGDNRDESDSDADGEDVDDRQAPLGLTLDEMRETLADLPRDYWRDDRDGWLQVGFALHHETEGSDQGFKLWHDFSQDSEKFDKSDQRRVWRSFGKSGARKPLRFATLMNAAKEARLLDDLDDLEDDLDPTTGKTTGASASDDLTDLDDFDDVLGVDETKRAKKLKAAEIEADLGHVPPKVKRLNRKHAVAFVKGKTVIITEGYDGSTMYGSPADLHQWYENDRVATEKATEPVTKAWMRHKKRREYPNGIIFAPGLTREGCFNHWKGWSVIPDEEGSCALWLQHLREVICGGVEEYFNYALRWFAHMVQRPWEKPGVAVVLRGKKRIGKDTIMDYFGGCCADHHVKIANQEQLTGKFNSHQEKCLILHVEEGFWAGSKQAEGSLKHLITSEKVLIEPKGLNAFHVDSYLRLFISSNEEWVVPATADEGRYFVLDVSAHRKDDHAYFKRMRTEMNNGGRAALLHYLMNVDLTGFEVRAVPDTSALGQQKVQGLKNVEKFWFDMLDTGEMLVEFTTADGRAGSWIDRSIRVDRSEFQDRYGKWLAHRKFDGSEIAPAIVGKKLSEMLCGQLETVRAKDGKQRPRQYVFPKLIECRNLFQRFMGSTMEWDEPIDDAELDEPASNLDDFDDFDI